MRRRERRRWEIENRGEEFEDRSQRRKKSEVEKMMKKRGED